MSVHVALFWGGAAVCVVAQLLIARSVFAPHPDATGGDTLPRSGRTAEILWVLLPALILALVLAMTWRAVRTGSDPAGTGHHASRVTHHALLES